MNKFEILDNHYKNNFKQNTDNKMYKNKITEDMKSTKNRIISIQNYGKRAIQKNFKEFLENTSLHGLKYTADKNISLTERIFFVFSFIFVLILSAYFIFNVFKKWSDTPVIISISPTPTYTSTIPFPAVTICGMNQAKKSKVQMIKKGTLEHSLLQSLCARDVDSDRSPTISGKWTFFRNFVLNVSTACNEMIIYCLFGGIQENCNNIFEPVLTDDGLCCTFNSVASEFMFKNWTVDDMLESESDYKPNYNIVAIDWTPETGYPENLPENHYPRITKGTGSAMGLKVVLNATSDEYFCSTTQSVGFKILIHNPTTQPKIANYGIYIATGQDVRIQIIPHIQKASLALRKIDKDKRHCLFANEGNLTYFRTYSRKNCQLECESRLLQKECNCFLYYMPRLSSDTRLCGPKDDLCVNRIQREIESTSNKELSCENCLSACFELSYSTTLSTTKLIQKHFLTRYNYPENIFKNSTKDISLLSLFYENNLAVSNTKDELIGFTDFLSNTGGLLGLFMGFSIFSLIEIVYFMTIRPYCAIRTLKDDLNRKLRKNKSNQTLGEFGKNFWKKKSIQFHDDKISYNSTIKCVLPLENQNQVTFLKRGKQKQIFPYYE